MAKKKSASSANSTAIEKKAPAKSAAKASANGSPAKPSSKKTPPTLDEEQIGLTAGAVWAALSKSGDTTLTALKKEVDSPADLVAAAVGWLAREEKLAFDTSGRTVKISLK